MEIDTLQALCEFPLTSVAELSTIGRFPITSLKAGLAKLVERGLIDSCPHRLELLGARPQRRFYPTREGIDAHAECDASEAPLLVKPCRSGPYDMRLGLPSGGSIGLARQGPMLASASLRYRVRTIERMNITERPLVTLILTDSEQDMRRTLRTIADPSEHRETCVAITAEAIIGKAKQQVWQPGGYGYASIPMFAPTRSLADIVSHTNRLGAAYHSLNRSNKRRVPDASRAALPDTTAQFDRALPFNLSRAEKRALDLLANWPFSSAEQLAGLMNGVSKRHANQLLRSLRDQGLLQREELGFVLSDQGLTYLVRRDRAAAGPTFDRWTPLRDQVGYIGSGLQTMANQHRHQAGVTEFCAMLSAEAAHSTEHEILDLLPTHRSQISYEHRGTRYTLYPTPHSSSAPATTGTGAYSSSNPAPRHPSGCLSDCAPTDATSGATTSGPTTTVNCRSCSSCLSRSTPKRSSSTPPSRSVPHRS